MYVLVWYKATMDGYRKGLTGPVLEYAVKKYKSHRRLFSSLLVETLRKNN